uniref:Uncharacterized protein n=1 Tax=Steinernema glaseri TaxID=37863 RepID=A0A1I7Y4K8_9BILA
MNVCMICHSSHSPLASFPSRISQLADDHHRKECALTSDGRADFPLIAENSSFLIGLCHRSRAHYVAPHLMSVSIHGKDTVSN